MTKEEKTKKLDKKLKELYKAAVDNKDAQMVLNILDRFKSCPDTSSRLEKVYKMALKAGDLQTALCIIDRLALSTDSS